MNLGHLSCLEEMPEVFYYGLSSLERVSPGVLWLVGQEKSAFCRFLFVCSVFFFDLQPASSRTKSLPWAA